MKTQKMSTGAIRGGVLFAFSGRKKNTLHYRTGALLVVLLAAALLVPVVARAQVPVYEITPVESKIKFGVKASVPIEGVFDKWTATLTFGSTDLSTGVLEIKIEADSVNTGSGLKNGKLKGKDFFDVKQDPLITFRSTKIIQTGSNTFEVDGNFTIRGVTKPEKLALELERSGPGVGAISGVMAFDRKEYGMNSGIPFITVADRVEVSVDLRYKRTSGPAPGLKP
jgi:polyisoprenoid-binding protein YceI